MNISDLIVIYLAFGAPFAVYKYLQSRSAHRGRKIVSSLATLVFWIPLAVRLASRHLGNAYFTHEFVSHKNSDSVDARLTELRDVIKTELLEEGCGLGVHDVREVIERYTGLSRLLLDEPDGRLHAYAPFFDAAGKDNNAIGGLCLTRRNHGRVRRHQGQAREHFIALFDGRDHGQALNHGIDLARQVGDRDAVDRLERMVGLRSALWNPEQTHELAPVSYSAAAAPLQVTATSLKGD